jgi:RNA polymerase sigma-70 factor (ECF subfamily)
MTPLTINHRFIQHIINVDKESYSVILDQYWDKIFHHIQKIVKDTEQARDITSEVFAKVYLNLNLFKPNFKFNSWIYKVATNTAIDYLRSEKLRNDIQIKPDDYIQVADDSTADTAINKKEKNNALDLAISMLKEEYRIIIRLRYYEELSYEEIARTLHIPIGTVKANLFRAKKMLSKIVINQKK